MTVDERITAELTGMSNEEFASVRDKLVIALYDVLLEQIEVNTWVAIMALIQTLLLAVDDAKINKAERRVIMRAFNKMLPKGTP